MDELQPGLIAGYTEKAGRKLLVAQELLTHRHFDDAGKVKILGQPASSYVGSKIWSAMSRHLGRKQALKSNYAQQPGMNREWMAILDDAPWWKAIRIRRLGASRRKKRRFKSASKVKPGQAAHSSSPATSANGSRHSHLRLGRIFLP